MIQQRLITERRLIPERRAQQRIRQTRLTALRWQHLVLVVQIFFALFASAFWLSKALAVELSQQQYQQIIQDVKQIYSENGSGKALQLLRQEPMENVIHYFPPGENQGVLTIKTPLKADSITVIQIPHAFFDLHSLDIGQQLFDSEWADVLMINTEHRYETKNSDLARLRYSLFTGTVDALKQINTQMNSQINTQINLQMNSQINAQKKHVRVIQIHGYNEKKRKTASAQQADMILSNGSVTPDTYMLQMQSCLRDSSQLLARVYGRDVFELGATVNPVGKLLRRESDHQIQFLHVELPRRIREAMVFGVSRSFGESNSSGESGAAEQKIEPQRMRQVMKCLLHH